jgi:hypothetical protein
MKNNIKQYNVVSAVISRNSKKRKIVFHIDQEDIEKYKNNEISCLQLSEKYGYNKITIWDNFKAKGIKKNKFKIEDVSKQDLEDLVNGVLKINEIVEKYNVCRSTLIKRMHENGIYFKRGHKNGN